MRSQAAGAASQPTYCWQRTVAVDMSLRVRYPSPRCSPKLSLPHRAALNRVPDLAMILTPVDFDETY